MNEKEMTVAVVKSYRNRRNPTTFPSVISFSICILTLSLTIVLSSTDGIEYKEPSEILLFPEQLQLDEIPIINDQAAQRYFYRSKNGASTPALLYAPKWAPMSGSLYGKKKRFVYHKRAGLGKDGLQNLYKPTTSSWPGYDKFDELPSRRSISSNGNFYFQYPPVPSVYGNNEELIQQRRKYALAPNNFERINGDDPYPVIQSLKDQLLKYKDQYDACRASLNKVETNNRLLSKSKIN